MRHLEELLEIAKSAKESFHKELPLKVVDEWKAFWMNQKQNNEKDYQNYWRRAFGIDANMSHHLANKIEKNFNIPQLADAVIDLITQLKDAQAEIKSLNTFNTQFTRADKISWGGLYIQVEQLEQRLAECETALKKALEFGEYADWAIDADKNLQQLDIDARAYLSKWSVK